MPRRRANEEQGRFATNLVADQYDLEVDTETADWYDAINPRTGAKWEVKSTHKELASGEPGRFRLWRDQLRSLRAADARGTGWMAFVLLDESDDVVAVQRRKPATVARRVRERGGWNEAGHAKREGLQHKLPWNNII